MARELRQEKRQCQGQDQSLGLKWGRLRTEVQSKNRAEVLNWDKLG